MTTVSPWLDFYLKGNCAAWNTFQDSLTVAVAAAKVTEQHNNAPQLPTVSITQSGNTLQAVAQHSTSLAWSTGTNTATISPTVSGIYTVTVTGVLGCTATASANLTFVSVADAAAFAEIQLYPNPSYEGATLHLKLPHLAALTVILTDATGRIIDKQSFAGMNTEYTAQLPTGNLPSGVYFVTAETSAGAWTGRWVKL